MRDRHWTDGGGGSKHVCDLMQCQIRAATIRPSGHTEALLALVLAEKHIRFLSWVIAAIELVPLTRAPRYPAGQK